MQPLGEIAKLDLQLLSQSMSQHDLTLSGSVLDETFSSPGTLSSQVTKHTAGCGPDEGIAQCGSGPMFRYVCVHRFNGSANKIKLK